MQCWRLPIFAVSPSLSMQKFEYRTPRYSVDLPVLLILKDERVTGRCREISSEGMKVDFRQTVVRNCCGTLRIGHGGAFLEVRARVTRTSPGSDGVKFLFASERERKALQRLVAITVASSGQHGPILVR